MTQKQIKQTLYSSLHCDMKTATYCLDAMNRNTPDSLRKAESVEAHYYKYDDGRINEGIILLQTKFNDDPQKWFFSVYIS